MKKLKLSEKLLYMFALFYALVCLYPIIWMGFYSLKSNEEIFVTNPFGFPKVPQWENYARALSEFDILTYFKNSVVITIGAMVLGIVSALMFTYVVARIKTKVTHTLRMIIMAGMFIPIQAIMTPLVVQVKQMHLSNTPWSLIIPYAALSFPFAVMVLYGFISNLPIELEESAYIDGANFYQTFFKIILPLLKPSISVLLIYQFMGNWNEFGLALVLITKESMKTLPLGLLSFSGQYTTDWGPMGAAMIIASIPVIVLYLLFSNKVEDAMAFSGMKN